MCWQVQSMHRHGAASPGKGNEAAILLQDEPRTRQMHEAKVPKSGVVVLWHNEAQGTDADGVM